MDLLPPGKKKNILALAFFAIVFLGAVQALRTETPPVWGVLLSDLPDKLVVGTDMTRGAYYVFKQTHEPLFRKDDGENFTSRVLSKWSRNISSSEYIFCPDTSLRFDENHGFSLEYFLAYIRNVTEAYHGGAAIRVEDACVLIKFPQPQRGYLDHLSIYENAPVIKRSPYLEEGLGKFKVTDLAKDRIVLDRKKPVARGYNRMILYRYNGAGDPNLGNKEITDFNFLPEKDKPAWLREKYTGFRNIALKVALLVINIPDPEIRKTVYNCWDIDSFKAAFMPAVENTFDIKTVLPLGFPGGQAGRPSQECGRYKGRAGKVVRLATWKPYEEAQARFASEFREKSGIELKIINYTTAEVQSVIHAKPHPYEIIGIGISALNSDHNTFLSTFLEEDAYFDFNIGKAREVYREMLKESDPVKKQEIGLLSARELEIFRGVLPLYQYSSATYYPKGIKNVTVGNEFSWYPEVADFRW